MKTLPSCEVTPTVRTALLLLTLLAILFLHATLRVCIQLPFSAHSGLATGASLRQPSSVTVAAAASAAAATSRRTAILTICTGPDFAGVHRFASSARTHAPGSDIVVFTDAPTLAHNPSLQVMYDLYQVKLVIMTPEALPEVARSFSATGTRHIVWRDWMRAQQAAAGGLPAYDMLLFCDSRDTVFQADPFARLVQAEDLGGGKGFYAFLESHDTIGGSEWNFKWVADCFGNEGLAEVQAFPVVCAGTSMGSWEDSMIYLDTMVGLLLEKFKCERNGVDQGMHNYIVHSGLLAKKVSALYKVPNEEGIILNAGIMRALERDSGGRILTLSGKVAAAVHQYDRFSAIARQQEAAHVWLPPGTTRVEHD